jgi:hypothetical protein
MYCGSTTRTAEVSGKKYELAVHPVDVQLAVIGTRGLTESNKPLKNH